MLITLKDLDYLKEKNKQKQLHENLISARPTVEPSLSLSKSTSHYMDNYAYICIQI
jgi:phosphoenolpyruvate carboxylase